MAIIGNKEYFKGIGEIKFEGKESDDPLAFKYYNPEQVVAGKTMREHFRFAIAYWHTFCGQGGDPFGPGTQNFGWDQSSDPMQAAKDKADAAFEFISKMGFDYFCFHDNDLIQEGATFAESESRLAAITEYLKEKKNSLFQNWWLQFWQPIQEFRKLLAEDTKYWGDSFHQKSMTILGWPILLTTSVSMAYLL